MVPASGSARRSGHPTNDMAKSALSSRSASRRETFIVDSADSWHQKFVRPTKSGSARWNEPRQDPTQNRFSHDRAFLLLCARQRNRDARRGPAGATCRAREHCPDAVVGVLSSVAGGLVSDFAIALERMEID